MKRSLKSIGLLLSFSVTLSYLPITAQALATDFETQLVAYAQTHTREEVEAYALTLLQEAQAQAEQDDGGSLLMDKMFPTLKDKPAPKWLLGGCLDDRLEACRLQYNSELFQATAISTVVLAGCTTVTALAGFIACAVLAAASQQSSIRCGKV